MNFCELEAHAPAGAFVPGEEQKTQVEILLFKDRLEELCDAAGYRMNTGIVSKRLFLD